MKSQIFDILNLLNTKLDLLNKREKILLLFLCFLLPFACVFYASFSFAKDKISNTQSQKITLLKRLEISKNPQIFLEKKDIKILEENVEKLQKENAILEQKNHLKTQKDFDFLAFEESLKKLSFIDFSLMKDKENYTFFALGNFRDFYSVLARLDSCFRDLKVTHFTIYPNAKNLEFYIDFKEKK